MQTKCLKYRLYPTREQETLLHDNLEICREVYNSFLLQRIVSWETEQKSLTYYDQANFLPVWKQSHPELSTVFSQVLQNVAVRVDLAFKAFFQRVKKGDTPGFPRFKKSGYDSITYPKAGFKIGENSVYLSKIGTVKAILHRTIEGKVKTCCVRKQNDKWFVCFSVEYQEKFLPVSEESIGIDVGLEKFASLSDGSFVENPRFFRRDEKDLAKAQKKASLLKNARSKEQKDKKRKANKVVARIHERIRNRRHNFIHQLSRKLVNKYGLIAVEKLNIKNIMASPAPKPDPENEGEFLPNGASAKSGLSKSIGDVAWSMFRFALSYKAESASRKVVEVNPAYTSQDCSGCGNRAKKTLKERWHFCPNCGLSLDRDTNAALNILKIGMGQHTVAG